MGKKDFAPIDYNKVIKADLDKVVKGYTGVKISASVFNRLSQVERVAKLKDFGGKLFASYIKKKISCLSSEHEDSTPSMGFYAGESYVGFNCLGCESKYDIFDIVGAVYHLGSFKDKYSKCVALFCEQGSDRSFKGYGNKSYAYAGSSKVKQSSFKTLTPFEKTLKNKYYIEFPESPEDETQDLTLIDAASYLKKRGIFLGSASIGNNVRYWDYNNYTYIVFVNDDGTVCKYAAGSDLDDGVLNSFKNMASNLHIIDYNTHPFMSITDTNIQEESILGRLIEGYSKLFVQNPVFIIDSLQSIAVDYNRTSKEGVDLALANLKHYERKYHARMIVVSNLSRMYYDKDLDISCLKESGNIEYEASCILGMEIAGSAINLNDFRQELVRQIKIKNLKDRSGGYKEVVVEFDVLRSSFSTIQKNTSTPPKEGKSRKVSKDKKASDKVAKDNADFMDLFNKPLSDKELEALEMLNNGIKSGS